MSPLLLQEVGQLINKLNDHMYWMIQRSDLRPFFCIAARHVVFFLWEIAMILYLYRHVSMNLRDAPALIMDI